MPELMKAIILGIVEGVTEFLPISSTGHLIVTSALLKFHNSLNGSFEIFIQIGAVFAVLSYYRADIMRQIRGARAQVEIRRFWLAIALASIPTGAIGFLTKDWVKAHLFSPAVVAITLIAGGVIFLIVERWVAQDGKLRQGDVAAITLRQALAIGLAQTLALVPGASRSGASIIGGMLVGLKREAAAAFSFYLAIPVLGGATVYELVSNLNIIQPDNILPLITGAVVSAIVAWFSIDWLLRYVGNHNFIVFGFYRIAAGALILALVAAGVL